MSDDGIPKRVAALFVDENGIYSEDEAIDLWGASRDARLYNGPYPVIAHPPCQRYGNLGIANYARWGGEHNRPLNDGGCFAAALAAVNCWGGVLEHPASSAAWPVYNIAKPEKGKWKKSGIGFVCQVAQSSYGHLAKKNTWLYYVGSNDPFPLRWKVLETRYQVGFPDKRGKDANKPTISKKQAEATPNDFKCELVKLALHSIGKRHDWRN